MPGITEDVPTAGGDELDDLFDYDVPVDDVFRQIQERADQDVRNEQAAKAKDADLGLEEITVEKKRAPIAKLDDNRLLSAKGIPKLRRIAKERMKFKGKGHEYSDVARMLNMYQLWLDDLYPRAKFADGLAIIEKLGHTKRMQLMRKEWIDEGKPKETSTWDDTPAARPDQAADDEQVQPRFGAEQQDSHAGDSGEGQEGENEHATRDMPTTRDNDDLFLTDDDMVEPGTSTAQPDKPTETNDEPPDDVLDALMAEDETSAAAAPSKPHSKPGNGQAEPHQDDFADEEAAMADMDMW